MPENVLAVALAKVKMTGLVVAAAAIGGTAVAAGSIAMVPTAGDTAATAEPTPTPTDSASPAPTDGTAPVVTTESPSPTHTPLPCPSDAPNHGSYVSQVAHDDTVKGREHGKAVSEAAKSDCGKTGAEDATEAPEAEESEAPDADTPTPHNKAKKDRGHKHQ